MRLVLWSTEKLKKAVCISSYDDEVEKNVVAIFGFFRFFGPKKK